MSFKSRLLAQIDCLKMGTTILLSLFVLCIHVSWPWYSAECTIGTIKQETEELKGYFEKEIESLRYENKIAMEKLERKHALEIRQIRQTALRNKQVLRNEIMDLKLRLKMKMKMNTKQFSLLGRNEKMCKKKSDTIKQMLKRVFDRTGQRKRNTLPIGCQRRRRSFPHVQETDVAFFANMPVTTTNIGAYKTIVFNNSVTNVGNAYNASSGEFEAPLDGVFVFYVTLTRYMDRSWAYLLHNDLVVAKLNFYNVEELSSQTVILNLKKGDQVTVKNMIANRGFGGDLDSTFAGFLLYRH